MSFEAGRYRIEDLIRMKLLEIGDGYRAKNTELSSSGVPFARAGNINDGFRFDGADFFPEADLQKVRNKVSQAGDVVFTSKGTVGRFALVRPSTPRFVYSPQLCFWRSLDRNVLLPEYLYYWMNSSEFLQQISYLKGQTDMADYVSLRDQRNITATIPSTAIQRQLVDMMAPLDARIALSRETSATLEAIAKVLFKSWFVDFDPVRAKQEGRVPDGMDEATAALFPDSFAASPNGLLPSGWGIQSLDQIATYLNGLALQKFPPAEDSWLPVIKIAQLRKGDTVGADRAGRNIKPEYIIRDGDVLFSWSGSLEVEIWCGGEGALNQHLFKVTSDRFPKWFYYLWTKHHLENFRQIAASKATTMGHIQRGHLSQAKVTVPPDEVVRDLSKLFGPLLDRSISALLKAQNLAALRDILLPRLISGQLRLQEADEILNKAA